MKRIVLLFLLVITALSSKAQLIKSGDLILGPVGGYASKFKGAMYGLSAGYQLTETMELNLMGLLNPTIKLEEKFNSVIKKTELSIFSADLDLRFYMIRQDTWGIAPAIGAKFTHKETLYLDTKKTYNEDFLGFNFGGHFRANLSDYITVNAGYRYLQAASKYNSNHHYFYLGAGYTFSLY